MNASLYISSLASYGIPLHCTEEAGGLTCCQTGMKTNPCWQHIHVVNEADDAFL